MSTDTNTEIVRKTFVKRLEFYLSLVAAVGATFAVATAFFLTPYRLDAIESKVRDSEAKARLEFDAVAAQIESERRRNELMREGLIRIEEQTRAIRERVEEIYRKPRTDLNLHQIPSAIEFNTEQLKQIVSTNIP